MVECREVIVVGAGLAGLSAAIYLGRAMRDVLVIGSGHSMAIWEYDVQNYLGFPEGISGLALLERGRTQAEQYYAEFVVDAITGITGRKGDFRLKGARHSYRAKRVLIATGLTHLPPEIPGVTECLGHSLFFCKDCDGYRVIGKRIAIVGHNDDAVEYALGMLAYSPSVLVATNGREPVWDDQHCAWLREYEIPLHYGRIEAIAHVDRRITGLCMEGGRTLAVDYVFTTRGDVVHNALALELGCAHDEAGQVVVDLQMETTQPGVYAAGCLTPANCQMIIAAGQGATAAQAINRDLFLESLETHDLKRHRLVQLEQEATLPEILE